MTLAHYYTAWLKTVLELTSVTIETAIMLTTFSDSLFCFIISYASLWEAATNILDGYEFFLTLDYQMNKYKSNDL